MLLLMYKMPYREQHERILLVGLKLYSITDHEIFLNYIYLFMIYHSIRMLVP